MVNLWSVSCFGMVPVLLSIRAPALFVSVLTACCGVIAVYEHNTISQILLRGDP